LKIPTSFRLLAHKVTVHRIPAARWKHADCVAYYEADKHRIYIRESTDAMPGHCFFHELTHAVLGSMGHKLNTDEAFVDNFSGLLHQAFTSARYKAEPRQPRRSRKGKSEASHGHTGRSNKAR
jgi:hypothetical protein